jgi:hypothetical protein
MTIGPSMCHEAAECLVIEYVLRLNLISKLKSRTSDQLSDDSRRVGLSEDR